MTYHSVCGEPWPQDDDRGILDIVHVAEEVVGAEADCEGRPAVGQLLEEPHRLWAAFVVVRRVEPLRAVFGLVLDVRSDVIISVGVGSRHEHGTCTRGEMDVLSEIT